MFIGLDGYTNVGNGMLKENMEVKKMLFLHHLIFPLCPESPVFSCLVACAANDDDYKKLVIDSGK